MRPTSLSGPESEGSDQEGKVFHLLSLSTGAILLTPGVVYGESVVRMAGGDKRRSWGENQSRVIFATGKKQASMMPSQDNQQGGKKAEELIQLRKDLEELRRRKQELREQFGENEKVLAEVEGWLATVGRQCEIARFKRNYQKRKPLFSFSSRNLK